SSKEGCAPLPTLAARRGLAPRCLPPGRMARATPALGWRRRRIRGGDRECADAGAGVRQRGDGRVPQGDLAEPSGAHQLDGGRDRGDSGAGVLPGRGRHRAGTHRREDPSMSGEPATATVAKQWFVVHTYSGFENKVAEAIQSRAKIFGMGERIIRVLVPTE